MNDMKDENYGFFFRILIDIEIYLEVNGKLLMLVLCF